MKQGKSTFKLDKLAPSIRRENESERPGKWACA